MGYLKFLGFTLLAVLVVGASSKLGGGIASLVTIVVSISLFWRYGPRIMALAYTMWAALVVVWLIVIEALLRAAPQAVAKYPAGEVQMAKGFWLLVGMLVLHPLCYALARFFTRRRETA